MKYYITLYIPSTNYQEISPLSIDEIQSMRKEEEEIELMENGDIQFRNIEISDKKPVESLKINLILKKAENPNYPCRRSIEISCKDRRLFLNSEDTSLNGLIKYSYNPIEYYNNDDQKKRDPLLNEEGNITHAVYSSIKRFYHVHEFHDETHDSILESYFTKVDVDINSPNNKALIHYLKGFEQIFKSYASNIKNRTKEINDNKSEDEYVTEEEYELILEDISNILGINIYANTLLLSNSFRDSTTIIKEDEECIFSQIALDLRNLIEYIVSKKDFFHTLFDNEILKNIKRIKTVQTDAEINSKRLGRLSYFLGGITIVSFIIMVLQVMHIIK